MAATIEMGVGMIHVTQAVLLTAWREEHMPFLAAAENREKFFIRVSMFLPASDERYKLIELAYNEAKDAFREVKRSGGERYFEHLRAVALILLEYLEIRDYELIIAALLHDIVEDIPAWTIERVQTMFGARVAGLVEYLTEPTEEEFGSKESAEHAYHGRFEFAPRDFFIIKLADRVHNLLTIDARPRNKQLAKVAETKQHYMPYARKHLILLPELRRIISLIEG